MNVRGEAYAFETSGYLYEDATNNTGLGVDMEFYVATMLLF
jgi:hypothetical protein